MTITIILIATIIILILIKRVRDLTCLVKHLNSRLREEQAANMAMDREYNQMEGRCRGYKKMFFEKIFKEKEC